MSYIELIKNFERIRDYMREFYIYGFKSRDDFNKKSSRSYDYEKRRIESYLKDYMEFANSKNGKRVFLSIDSRKLSVNPLYKALKSKSFTDNDITLHFILLDILSNSTKFMSTNEIKDKLYNEYISMFDTDKIFDEKTISNKLNEYVKIGILGVEKTGKQNNYYKVEDNIDLLQLLDVMYLFSEIGFCGVVGSYILDKLEIDKERSFIFKHHYITPAIDSEILYKLFDAMSEKCVILITNRIRHSNIIKEYEVIPLKIFTSVQGGRQYLMAYNIIFNTINPYRIDYIVDVKKLDEAKNFDKHRKQFEDMQKYMWGVMCNKHNQDIEHIDFTIHIEKDEEYIINRLKREKRCGIIEKIDDNTYKFTADVYSSEEMIPWIRTFICRIKSVNFSNRTIENRFKSDLEDMYKLYDIK